ncbi:serine/threonine-protein kinase [Pyxidicoccus xibeiensis]|uniref:serine/threonine-protein kinase n=1 Tax=Pyxidicoccus xibeiensis TaxID=2906759 RepID=UPI0020A73119|nr:serine/threonine-protein kinase [Pyxidicoccus xibeiensis]MCP3136283.1 serine/threonine protein kinase [Pyxidicoccus xibeiensis]
MESPRAMKDLAPATLPPGTEIGSWRVLERRGRGNYGAVYLVEQLGDPDAGPFALKLATHPLDPRFDREEELLSCIHHPGVPRLHAHGLWAHPAGPFPYLVMEWVEGQPLYDWGREQHPTSRQVLRLLAHVARALEATHAVGAVHRDVKGDNVLVRTSDGHAILTDFGAGNIRGARTLTAPPLPPGTPSYRSPEAIRFQWGYRSHPTAHYEAQPADDVYALGVTAYQLVTGTYPPPPRVSDTAASHDTESAPGLVSPRLRNPAVCAELDALILRMLAEHPEDRPGGGSADAVASALEHAAEHAGPEADVPLSEPVAPSAARAHGTDLGHAAPAHARAKAAAHTHRACLASPSSSQPAHCGTGWTWLGAAAVALLCLLSAMTSWWVHPVEDEAPPAHALLEPESRDGGTISLGDAAVASPVTILAPVPTFGVPPGLGLPMPKGPFPGQRKPPCNRKGEVELRGGCWYELARVKAPCDDDAYDYKGACYLPSFPVQRPTTSAPADR